jgi:acyl carrier protein
MQTDAICGQLKSFLVSKFPLARKRNVGVDDPLLGGGIIDSLGVLDIVGYIENEFQIAVADEDLSPENFETIGCLAAFVERKLARFQSETNDGNGAASQS